MSLKKLEEFIAFPLGQSPSNEDILSALMFATENDVVVNLKWFIKYSGWKYKYIFKGDSIKELTDEIRNRVYGV